MIFVPFGMLFAAYIFIAKTILHWPVSPNYPLLDVLILIFGVQFILFAMLFDMQESKDNMRWSEPMYKDDTRWYEPMCKDDMRWYEPMCKNGGNRE